MNGRAIRGIDTGGNIQDLPGWLSTRREAKQRVAIARALVMDPLIVFADEPTGNLNSAQGEEIMDIFKKLHTEGTTIIQVTHSEKNASYGQRMVNLLDGRIV